MKLIPCTYCGPRNVSEFRHGGETSARPDPNRTTREEWSRYLYSKTNAADWTLERWFHAAGCRRYFLVERHTLSNEIRTMTTRSSDTGADR
jgi:sarcosine oxidase subunit delta